EQSDRRPGCHAAPLRSGAMSVHLRPLTEPVPPVTPVAAVPDAAAGAPTPQQMLAFLQRAIAETGELRGRLDALREELEAAAVRLAAAFGQGPKLTAVEAGPQVPAAAQPAAELEPPSPAMSVAIEMAVLGHSREEVRSRLADAFSIAQP